MDEVMAQLWPERSGILNWLIAGALDYLNSGLRTPPEVIEATAEYRDEMDPVGTFVGACVENVPPNANGSQVSIVTAREMYDAFVAWAIANAVRPWKEKALARRCRKRGLPRSGRRKGFGICTSGSRTYQPHLADAPKSRCIRAMTTLFRSNLQG